MSSSAPPLKGATCGTMFATQADADAVQAALDAGQTFDDLVAAGTIEAASILGAVAAGDLFDPAVAQAAFAMDEGGTQIVSGRAGARRSFMSRPSAG